MCLAEGRVTSASIADHIEPHRGDQLKFFLGELQSLCPTHHESSKKRQEHRGYSTQVGPDGWPVDPEHPFYTGKVPDEVEPQYTGEIRKRSGQRRLRR
jgi:hypothetical protein